MLAAEGACDRAAQLPAIGAAASSVSDGLLQCKVPFEMKHRSVSPTWQKKRSVITKSLTLGADRVLSGRLTSVDWASPDEDSIAWSLEAITTLWLLTWGLT